MTLVDSFEGTAGGVGLEGAPFAPDALTDRCKHCRTRQRRRWQLRSPDGRTTRWVCAMCRWSPVPGQVDRYADWTVLADVP